MEKIAKTILGLLFKLLIVALLFVIITFVIYIFNLDMKAAALLEPFMTKIYDNVERDRHL